MVNDTSKRADGKPTKISGEIREASMDRTSEHPKETKKNK